MAKVEKTPEAKKALESLGKLTQKLEKARAVEREIWNEVKTEIKTVYDQPGVTYNDLANILGTTRARIYQLVTGKRWTPNKEKVNA